MPRATRRRRPGPRRSPPAASRSPGGQCRSRTAQIVVDHFDRGPAHGARTIGQAILPTSALVIIEHLVAGRLANVDESAAGEVVRRDPGHHRPPRRRAPSTRSGTVARPPPPPAAPAVAAPAWTARRAEAPSAVPLRRTDPSVCVVLSASPAPLQRGQSPAHEAMSTSTRARRSASRSTGSRGHATRCCADRLDSVVHAGNSARVRSGWRMTKCSAPP